MFSFRIFIVYSYKSFRFYFYFVFFIIYFAFFLWAWGPRPNSIQNQTHWPKSSQTNGRPNMHAQRACLSAFLHGHLSLHVSCQLSKPTSGVLHAKYSTGHLSSSLSWGIWTTSKFWTFELTGNKKAWPLLFDFGLPKRKEKMRKKKMGSRTVGGAPDLNKSFNLAVRSLLTTCPKQKFSKAFPTFTSA